MTTTEEPLTAVRTLKEVYDYLVAIHFSAEIQIDYAGSWYTMTNIAATSRSYLTGDKYFVRLWNPTDLINVELDAHKFRRVRFA